VNLVIGLVLVSGSVVGGYVLSHGELRVLWQPFEVLIICGSAMGAFVIANPMSLVRQVLRELPRLLRPSPFDAGLHMETLLLLHALFDKGRRSGLLSLEQDIEDPASSEIFRRHPGVLSDHHAVTFIRDYMRLIISGDMDAFQLENLMDVELESHHHEAAEPGHAVNRVADALPGFGIVAAVLGIVNTMGALGGPIEEIGKKVAVALVGSFLGILLAYGFVGPLATALTRMAEDEGQYFATIKTCILASLRGYSPKVAVEFGRKAIPPELRPEFEELEEELKGLPAPAAA
jgi:chemotaxis protein MotA